MNDIYGDPPGKNSHNISSESVFLDTFTMLLKHNYQQALKIMMVDCSIRVADCSIRVSRSFLASIFQQKLGVGGWGKGGVGMAPWPPVSTAYGVDTIL